MAVAVRRQPFVWGIFQWSTERLAHHDLGSLATLATYIEAGSECVALYASALEGEVLGLAIAVSGNAVDAGLGVVDLAIGEYGLLL